MIQRIVAIIGSLVLLLVVVVFLNSTSWSLESYGGGGGTGTAGGTGATGTAGGTGGTGAAGGTGGTGATGTAGGTGGTGAAATSTAFPSPTFIAATGEATPVTNPTPTISGSVQAGDCMVIVLGSATNNVSSINFNLLSGYGEVNTPSNWQANSWAYNMTKIVTPPEITSTKFLLTGVGSAAVHPYCMAFFRHVTCSNDAGGTATSAGSTAPQPPSITTSVNGDQIVSVGIVNGNTGMTYTPPTGYTNDVYIAPVTGNAFGCYIDHKTAIQTTAGATQPGAGTLSASVAWYAAQWALINLSGTP